MVVQNKIYYHLHHQSSIIIIEITLYYALFIIEEECSRRRTTDHQHRTIMHAHISNSPQPCRTFGHASLSGRNKQIICEPSMKARAYNIIIAIIAAVFCALVTTEGKESVHANNINVAEAKRADEKKDPYNYFDPLTETCYCFSKRGASGCCL